MYYDNVINKPPFDEIYHHGIKGQKWGVKNGPPYPLDSSKSTGPRLKTTKSSGKKNNTQGSALLAYALDLGLIFSVSVTARGIRNFARDISLNTHQKMNYLKDKEKQTKLKDLRKSAKKDKETGLKLKKNQNASMDEDMDAVNFYRGKLLKTKRTYTNCAYCTTAYDLRRRGFEVRAKNSTRSMDQLGGVSNEEILSWYKNPKKVDFKLPNGYDQSKNKTATIMKKELLKQPDGSRGNMCVRWRFGGGHSVAYEIKNRKIIILDTQANVKYEGHKVDEFLNSTTLNNNPWFMRTDNLEPNYKLLKKKGIIE